MISAEEKMLRGILTWVQASSDIKKARAETLLKDGPSRPLEELWHKRALRGTYPESELWKDIMKHGVCMPIVILPDGLIVDGLQRYYASKEAGFTHIPVRVI